VEVCHGKKAARCKNREHENRTHRYQERWPPENNWWNARSSSCGGSWTVR
jgi:hypothetical protein